MSAPKGRINATHQNVPAEYRRCRVYGHTWDSKQIGLAPGMIYDHLECEHCGTKRVDRVLRGSGITVSRRYEYAKNYHIRGTLDRNERGLLRLDLYGKEPT